MVQLAPAMEHLVRWGIERGVLPESGGSDLGYVLHALLHAAFGALAPRPYALQQRPQRPAQLLAYTGHPVAALRAQAAAFAEPAASEALGVASLAGKAMPDRFVAGQHLGFTVHVRPVVRTDKDGDRDRAKEVDAFLLSPIGSGRGEVYAAWLARHLAAGGATLDGVALDAFQLLPVQRRDGARRLRGLGGPDATLSGTLRVTDPDAFAALLTRGVGRHRAFGYGMLLLRPA